MRLALALVLAAGPALAGSREIEVGLENFYYRTSETPLNPDNVLGLDRAEDRLRGTLSWKESRGDARVVFKGYVERGLGGRGDETAWTARQAYAQYAWGSGLQLRAGKQRIAWGSGFAWNPTNRLEPPKNPANTGLEQEGAWAARLDVIPNARAGIILVAARGDTSPRDLPFAEDRRTRHTAALRARFLVKDTDLALVFSGGEAQRTLLGFDLSRAVGNVSLHAEAALYRGSEIAPPRDEQRFSRVVTGLLYARDTTAWALEYFWNGEGYHDSAFDAWRRGLDVSYARATDPRLPSPLRQQALAAYAQAAAVPYSGGLGLRRHYLHASWTRSEIRGEWTAALRGTFGLGDGGAALTPGLQWAPRGNLVCQLDAILLVGPGASEYRLAPARTAVQARVRVLF